MKKIKTVLLALTIMLCFAATACAPQEGETPHVHDWGDWQVVKAATCSIVGEETRICQSDPTHTQSRKTEIDPAAHSWGDWEQKKAATCMAAGEETRTCTNNYAHRETRIVGIKATAHSWSDWQVVKAATCTTAGEETRTCANNRTHTETRTIAIKATAHSWGDWIITKQPTATEDGEETRTCKHNAAHKETRVIAKGTVTHEWGAWIVTKAATCTTEGEETRTCSHVPAHRETRTIGIIASAHSWGEWVVTKQPTATEDGEETRTCKHNAAHKETRSISKSPMSVESITVAEGNTITLTHNVDSTKQLNVRIKYTNKNTDQAATRDDVIFASNNHAAVTVNADGKLSVQGEGEAQITVESVYNNVNGIKVRKYVDVTVKHAPITSMTLTSADAYTVVRGLADTRQGVTADATAQIELNVNYIGEDEKAATKADVAFLTGDETIASVNENGLITFNGVGSTTITVKSKYEQQNGGFMEQTIAVQVNPVPENKTGLEIVRFEVGVNEDNERYLRYVIKNVTDKTVEARILYVYYLDATGKILTDDTLLVASSLAWTDIKPNEEIQHGEAGGIKIPAGTARIHVYGLKT